MKRKIIFGILFLVIGFSFYKRYEIYYFFQGKIYLKPNEMKKLVVKPNYEQIEYSSELYMDSDEEIFLKLEGRDIWYEKRGWTYKTIGNIGYVYDIQKQDITKYEQREDGTVVSDNLKNGYNGTTIDKDGIMVPLKGERKYNMTEGYDYTITITNLSDKPVAFSAFVVNR